VYWYIRKENKRNEDTRKGSLSNNLFTEMTGSSSLDAVQFAVDPGAMLMYVKIG
jgi:hypothetical protein